MKFTDAQRLWIDTLKTTDKKQGRVYLHHAKADTWCCLGIACDLFVPQSERKLDEETGAEEFDGKDVRLPSKVQDLLGLHSMFGDSVQGDLRAISAYNDSGMSFREIADLLERNPECYFVKGAEDGT